ncbi:MAG TPA: nitroreductase family protein [Candidatus Binataceae bacterium]|jgi:nitroreductase|nr:nitroreductase family protein [Candidatus Binataceae bacterium]
MDALEALLTRRVARAYSDQPVGLEQLARIIDAGRHAMSARNLQPWQFIVVRERATLREMGALCSTGRYVADAPAAIVVLKDRGNTRWADVDCAHAVQNMANAGWAMGLGTCWVGNFDGDKLAALLGIPEEWPIFTVLPFGYPSAANPPQAKALKPRAEVVHYERWGRHTA